VNALFNSGFIQKPSSAFLDKCCPRLVSKAVG